MATSTNKRSSTRSPSLSDGIHELGATVRELAADRMEAFQDRAGEIMDRGRDKMHEVGEDIESRFHDQPMKSLLVAAGIGFLLGMIWRRR